MKTILFVDDHPVYRTGLQQFISDFLPDATVLAAAGASAALQMLADTPEIDLCLADYRLNDGDGISLISEIRHRHGDVAVGILAGELTSALIAQARAAGSVACLSKARDPQSLASAIEQIFAGAIVYDEGQIAPQKRLSIRRLEILRLAALGNPDKMIAQELGISEATVRDHWGYIFEQLEAGNKTEAVAIAVRLGIA